MWKGGIPGLEHSCVEGRMPRVFALENGSGTFCLHRGGVVAFPVGAFGWACKLLSW
ncbi:hypothetical protein GCM10010483_30240 [Actinokineospora diospyrosa]